VSDVRVLILLVLGALAAGCGGAAPPAANSTPAVPVWIDTDPSVAPGGHEVDDGFALIQAFHSPEVEVRGVSVVFGNAPLETAYPIGREIVRRFGPPGLEAVRGAAGGDELGQPTDASRALGAALERGPLVVLVLGPATNVATALMARPDLASRVTELVAVAGRRPGQAFVVGQAGGRPLRDLNFELDPKAFEVLLGTSIPVTLAPWEISSQVWIRASDLDALDKAGEAARFLVKPARDMLELFWMKRFGVDGLNPFDTLAVGRLTSPDLLTCDSWPAAIERGPDDTVDAGTATPPDKPYLHVGPEVASDRRVRYCHTPAEAFKDDLMRRLLSPEP
jgi:pyrimidine-specific ribonucleoside hydrolase